MSDRSAARFYAVRRLNPFLGIIEVVEVDGARALSADGAAWEIQVLTERPEHTWGSGNQHPPTWQYFRFGAWSARGGLSRVPLNPLLDIGAMLAACNRLLAHLEAGLAHLPFPLLDRYELWLQDRDARPLALLGSTVEKELIPAVTTGPWRAAAQPDADRFESRALLAEGAPGGGSDNGRGHAEWLERRVEERAGGSPRRQWYRRSDDGSGEGLGHRSPGGTEGRVLAATAFPPLYLRTDWVDATAAAVVGEYLDWCAPRLLTLPSLSTADRVRLERAARHQPASVDRLHRLYPQVLDRNLIDAARVEARLRRTA